MKSLAYVASLLLAACATTSDVVSLGSDKYMMGYQVRGGLTSWGEVKATAVQKATAYCVGKEKKIEVVDIQTSGAQGWTPQNADVTFKCL